MISISCTNKGCRYPGPRPEALASHNPALNAYCQEQVTELMTRYGPVDIVFLDGLDQFSKTELAKVCWDIQPGVVVTRGAWKHPNRKLLMPPARSLGSLLYPGGPMAVQAHQ
jgi:alpha-L-fucosidase